MTKQTTFMLTVTADDFQNANSTGVYLGMNTMQLHGLKPEITKTVHGSLQMDPSKQLTMSEMEELLEPKFQVNNKIGMIKYIRQLTGASLREAKNFYEDRFHSEHARLYKGMLQDDTRADLSPATDQDLRIERVQQQIDLIGEQVIKLHKIMEQAGLKALEEDAKGIF